MLSDDHRRAALDLLNFPGRTVVDVRNLAAACGVSLSTVYRWMAQVRRELKSPELARTRRRDRGESRLDEVAEADLQAALAQVTGEHGSVEAAYAALRLRREGRACPSRATFYRRWKALQASGGEGGSEGP